MSKRKSNISPSIRHAAALLGVSRHALKIAKRKGCEAFRGNGSIHIPLLQKWLAKHPAQRTADEVQSVEDSIEESERRTLAARALTNEHRLKTLRKTLVASDDMHRDFTRAVFAAKSIFGAIPDRVKNRIAGMTDPIEIDQLLRAEIIAGLSQLSSGDEWPSLKCPRCRAKIAAEK